MLSAPPVLVEPKKMIASSISPVAQEYGGWVTQTPEPSPMCFPIVPPQQVGDHFSFLQDACNPIWEQLLVRVASHADILEATQPAVRHQLIQTLCQPFFENAVETMCRDIGKYGLSSISGVDPQQMRKAALEEDKPSLNLRCSLGLWEEESTDADNDSAFASLFSSDGEDCDVESRREDELRSSRCTAGLVSSYETDSEPPQDAEKSQMVCRHWKSKGWCRYGCECKFLHPEEKRGVTTSAGDSSLLGSSKRRRGGKNKTSKVQIGVVDGSAVPLDFSAYWASSCEPCFPCVSTAQSGMWAMELQAFKPYRIHS